MINLQKHPIISAPSFIQSNIPLHDKNWFKTGGKARFFCEPTNVETFSQALAFAATHKLPIFVLGQGANILMSDEGFDGLVIRPQLISAQHAVQNGGSVLVTAGAGMTIESLITYCLDHDITGLEEFSGIPGTVGGSVYINLHYFEFLLDQFLVAATVINKTNGIVQTVDLSWFKFGYNESTLQKSDYYLVDATFKLRTCTLLETAFARGRSTEIIRHRAKRYPTSYTCGSFFRNFYEHEVSLVVGGKKIIYVAYYLDKIGIKGVLSSGDAIVSYQHANMIVNRGSATSTDIINLARQMQQLVKDAYGITPQPECQLVGFGDYPLIK